MLPDLETLEKLPEPFEILELADNERRTITPLRYELGRALIHPRDGREPKEIRALRLHVSTAEKTTLPAWWDLTSQHLVAGVLPHVEHLAARPVVLTITKHGEGARARFSLEVNPAPRT